MTASFPWTKDNFFDFCTSYDNIENTKKIIMGTDVVGKFKRILSIHQLDFYAYNSIVKYTNLLKNVNEKKDFSDNMKQQFQTEANFYIFCFLQTILPLRDLIVENGYMKVSEIVSHFDEGEFDFFISLRNLQTHVFIPVVHWVFHHHVQSGVSYIETPVFEDFIFEIEKDTATNKRKRFKYQGLEFIQSKNKVCFGILMTQFWKKMHMFNTSIYEQFLTTNGEELDVCEFYLKKIFDFSGMGLIAALKQAQPDITFDVNDKKERFYHILLILGGQPQFYSLGGEPILLDTA